MDSLENLRQEHNSFLHTVEGLCPRKSQWGNINWNEKLLFIKGPRGVGKSTMMLQFIKERFQFDTKALYVNMDSLNTSGLTMIEIAKKHQNLGGTHLYIDEIHKVEDWSLELKNINDLYNKLSVVVVGSSTLQHFKGDTDLTRKVATYNMEGLSFREYIELKEGKLFNKISIDDILKSHIDISIEINNHINPLILFKEYLQYGYYPFFLQDTKSFTQKLNNAVSQSIEQDILQINDVEVNNIRKIKKLLYHLAINVPFKPNSTKLSQSLELNRQTLNLYLNYLSEARLISNILSPEKSYSLISKPDKIYLNNTNLCFLVSESRINKRNLKETFFFNQLSHSHVVNTTDKADFLIDNKYIFKLNEPNNKINPIAEIKNSFTVLDEEISGYDNKIPLWLFGLLY
ncbi:MAG: AAA family ATPase [Saprospiraceae bacterium]|nr:AAA family ATPase [Saprospiraceae bacterium]